MSCCGTSAGYHEVDEVSRLVAARLSAFLKTLREAGFADVANLAGGMLRWRAEGHAVEGGSG